MKRTKRGMAGGLAALVLGLGLVGGLGAADDDVEVPKAVRDGLYKIADLIEKGKLDDAKKEAAALAKKSGFDGGKPNSCTDLMHGFAPRAKKGFGVGDKPGLIKPDGIESKIQVLGDDKKKLTTAVLAKEAPDLRKMAYITAAIALVTLEATPKKDDGKKKASDWKKWSEEMRDASLKLADVTGAKSPDPKTVQVTSRNLDGSCTECHQVFRK